MLYLMDANTFITAKDQYYQIERIPEFWDWLIHQGAQQQIKIPIEIFNEINGNRQAVRHHDSLAIWAKDESVKTCLLHTEVLDYTLVNKVITKGYLPQPTESDLLQMGQDPFLIAYALKDPLNRTVVTTEVSKPSKKGANRHVPDVCRDLGVKCCNTFQLLNELNFSTSWRSSV